MLLKKKNIYIYIYLFIQAAQGVSVVACRIFTVACGILQLWHVKSQLQQAYGIQLPDQGSNPGPPHWEHGVLATGPPGKSLCFFSIALCFFVSKHYHIHFWPTKRSVILMIGLSDLKKKKQCQRGWVRLPMRSAYNSQKRRLEDSPSSEEREMSRSLFQRGLSELVKRIKTFLLHAMEDPMILLYYLQYKKVKKKQRIQLIQIIIRIIPINLRT